MARINVLETPHSPVCLLVSQGLERMSHVLLSGRTAACRIRRLVAVNNHLRNQIRHETTKLGEKLRKESLALIISLTRLCESSLDKHFSSNLQQHQPYPLSLHSYPLTSTRHRAPSCPSSPRPLPPSVQSSNELKGQSANKTISRNESLRCVNALLIPVSKFHPPAVCCPLMRNKTFCSGKGGGGRRSGCSTV